MGMDDLLASIADAWAKLELRLALDTDELHRRLARRRLKMMRRAPRAWCITVRASDTRIHPGSARCEPEDAAYPASLRTDGGEPGEHRVTIDSPLLRRLCRPVYVPRPGMPMPILARELGCSEGNLAWALRQGLFKSYRDYAALGPKTRKCTYLYTPDALDPSAAKLRKFPDPLWGTTARLVADHIPDGIEQTLTRVPNYRDVRYGHTAELRARPPVRRHLGWKWVCPGCRRTCRVLYYPLRPLYGIQLLKRPPASVVDWLPEPLWGFACCFCHDVLQFSRVNADAWNRLICHLSGGLLYGSEVHRPADVVFQRQREFKRLTTLRPAPLRDRVQAELERGLSYGQIAWKLGLHRGTVTRLSRRVFFLAGVKGKAAFVARTMEVKGRIADGGTPT
jgi:hypothetical protein